MRALFRLVPIYVALLSSTIPYVNAQTLVNGYIPKVAGVPYHSIAADNEGNILVFQHFDQVDGQFVGTLAKLGADGSVVAGFNKVITDGIIGHVEVQEDGKILISGNFTTIHGDATPNLVRLNPDGIIDPSFTSVLDMAGKFKLQSDGKIVVIQSSGLVRLNTDGSLDTSFSMTGSFYLYGPLAIGPDDYIYFTTYSQVYRLKPNGEDDPDFYVGSGVNENHITSIAAQSDGKILVGGLFTEYNGIASRSLVRLLPNGQVDTGFKIGEGPEGQILEIVERANKNIVIGGGFSRYNQQAASLVELKPDGSLRKIMAIVSTNNITTIVESPDGKVTVAGAFTRVNGLDHPFLVKFNTDYTINNSFDPMVTYNNPNGRFLEVKKDGKILTGAYLDFLGMFQGSTVVRKEIVQMTTLGSYDNSFSPPLAANNPYIVSTLVQEDGKILLGGFVQDPANLIRLNADGSKDNSFQIGTGATTGSNLAGMPYKIKAKGNVLYFAGYFSKFNGVASQSIVATNLNGSIVQTFSALPPNSQINDFDFQSDGKIIVLGGFPFDGGNKNIVRLNLDGSLDQTFALTNVTGNFITVKTDAMDRIYLGGSFMTVNGALGNSLVRLLPDGNLDGSFDIGAGFEENVLALEFLPDGNIAVGGYFKYFNNEDANGFVMLDQNGARVATPSVNLGKNSVTIKIKYFNGALYIGGRYVKEDYSDVYGTAKISIDPVALPTAPDNLTVGLEADGVFQLGWNDMSSNELAFILERAVGSESGFTPYDTLDANTVVTLDPHVESHMQYSYRLKAVSDGGESSYSNIASFTWITAPAAQLNLTVTEQGENELLLAWSGTASHHDGFVIERSEKQEAFYIVVDTVSTNTYSYVDVVEPEKTYFYKVSAYNKGGRTFSNEVSLIISGFETVEGSIALFPVPADKFLFARTGVPEAERQWRLVSTTGHAIPLAITENINNISVMDIQQVPPGVYIAQYFDRDRILLSYRIMVIH